MENGVSFFATGVRKPTRRRRREDMLGMKTFVKEKNVCRTLKHGQNKLKAGAENLSSF